MYAFSTGTQVLPTFGSAVDQALRQGLRLVPERHGTLVRNQVLNFSWFFVACVPRLHNDQPGSVQHVGMPTKMAVNRAIALAQQLATHLLGPDSGNLPLVKKKV